jgi:hypothetical protein
MKGRFYGGQRDDALWQIVVANFSEEPALASRERSYAFPSADVDKIEDDRHGARP